MGFCSAWHVQNGLMLQHLFWNIYKILLLNFNSVLWSIPHNVFRNPGIFCFIQILDFHGGLWDEKLLQVFLLKAENIVLIFIENKLYWKYLVAYK